MTDTTGFRSRARQSGIVRAFAGVAFAVLVSSALNAVVATLAEPDLPAGALRIGLRPAEYVPMTVSGIVLATLAWCFVRRVARRPRAVMRVLATVAVLVSFVPDFGILTAGATLANALALMAMHVIVTAVTVPTLIRALPLPRDRT